MTYILSGATSPSEDVMLANMFRQRKRVFVDLLGWDVPVLADTFEVDQFDGPDTIYLVLADRAANHRGSMRLLPTDRPNILGSIFPTLCEGEPPCSARVWEISRFCLSGSVRASERRLIRNQLISTAVLFALENEIEAYCCVADMPWLTQILSFGWRCTPLGLPLSLECGSLGALRIEITTDAPGLMYQAGVWRPNTDGRNSRPFRSAAEGRAQ